MSVNGSNGVHVDRSRTAAATATRKQNRAKRLAVDLAPRVVLLPDDYLAAITGVLVAECTRRGVPIPDFLAGD